MLRMLLSKRKFYKRWFILSRWYFYFPHTSKNLQINWYFLFFSGFSWGWRTHDQPGLCSATLTIPHHESQSSPWSSRCSRCSRSGWLQPQHCPLPSLRSVQQDLHQERHESRPGGSQVNKKIFAWFYKRIFLDVRTKKLSLSRASEVYGIPPTTLWQRANRMGIPTPKKETSSKSWTDEDLQL